MALRASGESRKLVIASRKSALARLQSYTVGEALRKAWPHLEIEYLFKESLGDKNLDAPLWQMPEKGVFTRDLQIDLEAGTCDMVVHSWKDLPIEMPTGSEIAATLHREDTRDVLLMKRSYLKSAGHEGVDSLTILSSSPRRAYNLEKSLAGLLPFRAGKICFESIRGNVPTRVAKLLAHPSAGGLILARAALERLLSPSPVFDQEVLDFQNRLRRDLLSCEWMLLPTRLNPTAPAQAALAIEIRTDREDLRVLLERIHQREDFEDVRLERAVLALFGGGCHQKIGANVFRIKSSGKRVLVLKGQRDSGELLDFEGFVEDAPFQLQSLRDSHSTPKVAGGLWPPLAAAPSVFTRKSPISNCPTRASLGEAPLMFVVGRGNALPETWSFKPEDRVFVSGLKTWRKLAARGIWVNASFEGLGEERFDSKLVEPTLRTYKFSHSRAPVGEGQLLLASYVLENSGSETPLVPLGTKECFWMSASLFDEALRRDPELLKRVSSHACGPGHTQNLIEARIKDAGGELAVYLDIEHWWRVRSPQEKAKI